MKTTKLVCPKCGAEFAIDEHEHVVCGITIAEDSNLGTVEMPLKNKKKQSRIQMLQAAGIDTTNFFSLGNKLISVNPATGEAKEIMDDDPIIAGIHKKGTIFDDHLYKQHVMSQMLHNLVEKDWNNHGQLARWSDGTYHMWGAYTQHINSFSYEYSWEVLRDKLREQYAMDAHEDTKCFAEDNRWYNKDLAVCMMQDYLFEMKRLFEIAPTHLCHRRKYIKFLDCYRLASCDGIVSEKILNSLNKGLFVDDEPIIISCVYNRIARVLNANTPKDLYYEVRDWVKVMPKLYITECRGKFTLKKSQAWVDAYKGYGAYFTMQNMILFHNCFLSAHEVGWGHEPELLDKNKSLEHLDEIAKEYEGYEMLGALKQFIDYNHFDIEAKFEEWRAKYNA